MSAVAAARRRHPSTQSPVSAGRVVGEVARMLDGPGVRWPRIAAAALQLRGRSGLSPDDWARRLGVDPDEVRSAEAGERAVSDLPEPLRHLVRDLLADAGLRWR